MRSAFLYTVFLSFFSLSVLMLQGCSTITPSPATQPNLTFSHLQPFASMDAKVTVRNNYISAIGYDVLDQEIINNPVNSFYAWTKARFPNQEKVQSQDQLSYTINKGRLIKEKKQDQSFLSIFNPESVLKADLSITIHHINHDQTTMLRREKTYIINVSRTKSLLPKGTMDDRDKAATLLVEKLIHDFDLKFRELNL